MLASAIETFKSLISLGSEKGEEYSEAELPEFQCPICDQPMALRDVHRVEQFGLRDVRLHAMKCESCGMVADRIYHPSIGYDQNFVV